MALTEHRRFGLFLWIEDVTIISKVKPIRQPYTKWFHLNNILGKGELGSTTNNFGLRFHKATSDGFFVVLEINVIVRHMNPNFKFQY